MHLSAVKLPNSGKTTFVSIGFTIILLAMEELIESALNGCSCNREQWKKYTIFFVLLLFVPSIICYGIGLAINETFEELTTGKSQKCKFLCRKNIRTSLLAPLVWICVVFIDGDYLACTFSKPTYNIAENETCDQVSKTTYIFYHTLFLILILTL